jgi:Excalibur calcium-binding domain
MRRVLTSTPHTSNRPGYRVPLDRDKNGIACDG